MELMVVVIVISILAALALPSMVKARDDRRVYDETASVARLLRSARLRAVGRGAAVAVSMTTSNSATNRGTFQVFEAVTVNPTTNGSAPVSSASNRTPLSSCVNADWTQAPGAGNKLLVETLDLNDDRDKTVNLLSSITVRSIDSAGTQTNSSVTTAWLCFTPAGRPYVDTGNANPTFSGATILVDLNICVARGGLCGSSAVLGIQRSVLVPPTGMARMYSR